MMIVGLTGGIGSGKTTVANLFKQFDIPIYIADIEAKQLMNTSHRIRTKIVALFGDDAYKEDGLNRAFIAEKIFNDKHALEQMNAIVHPEVEAHFKAWYAAQKSPYVIKEAAIIFEHNKDNHYDKIITVIADVDQRIERVMKRDQSSAEKIKSIINNQLSDIDKVKRSDFVILNNDLETLQSQVEQIHQSLLKLVKPTSK